MGTALHRAFDERYVVPGDMLAMLATLDKIAH